MSEVLKTVGVERPDGNKDFDIYLMNGDVVRAVRNLSKFQVGDVTDTLKQIKILVMDGLRWEEGHEPLATGDRVDQAEEPAKLGAWDCVDPCALLTDLWYWGTIDMTPALNRTLDCHGWIDPKTGDPDHDRAVKDIERVKKLQGSDS